MYDDETDNVYDETEFIPNHVYPDTNPWSQEQRHFSSQRHEGLGPSSYSHIPHGSNTPSSDPIGS